MEIDLVFWCQDYFYKSWITLIQAVVELAMSTLGIFWWEKQSSFIMIISEPIVSAYLIKASYLGSDFVADTSMHVCLCIIMMRIMILDQLLTQLSP